LAPSVERFAGILLEGAGALGDHRGVRSRARAVLATACSIHFVHDGFSDILYVLLPLSIVLDIDTSLSTRRVLPLELNSARRFAQAILRPVDGLSLYGFSETVDQVVPFTAACTPLQESR
jgi:hypothetical protein